MGFGYVRPAWYDDVRSRLQPQVGQPERLTALAGAAGLSGAVVSAVPVSVGLLAPREQVGWRLGMAMFAGWLAGLDADTRTAVEAAAEATVTALLGPQAQALVLDVLILSSRAPA